MSSTTEKLEVVAREVLGGDAAAAATQGRELADALLSAKTAELLDERDELKEFRSEFWMPKQPDNEEKEVFYFTGNSLGLQPRATQSVLDEEMAHWRSHGVEGHFRGARPWVDTDLFVTAELAEMVGAEREEVAVSAFCFCLCDGICIVLLLLFFFLLFCFFNIYCSHIYFSLSTCKFSIDLLSA